MGASHTELSCNVLLYRNGVTVFEKIYSTVTKLYNYRIPPNIDTLHNISKGQ